MSNASEHQPKPKKGNIIVVDVVLDDIRERAETGKLKYGTYLETGNGRDALWDAYQEYLDGIMYLRQEILEKEQATGRLAAMQTRIEKLEGKLALCLVELSEIGHGYADAIAADVFETWQEIRRKAGRA